MQYRLRKDILQSGAELSLLIRLGGWVVGILESNAKLNSKLRLKLKLKIELSLAINTQNVLNTMEWPKTDYFCLNLFKTIENYILALL